MHQWLQLYEPWLRLSIFFILLTTLICLEYLRPRRVLSQPRAKRWSDNYGLFLIDVVCARVLFPLAAVGIALDAQNQGYGLFQWLDVPFWLAFLVGFLALDMLIYWQHRLFHQIPWLWRLHRVHHTDLDIDASTAVRFHPIEILLSLIIKTAVIALLGANWLTVLVFEIVLSATALFNHANLKIPPHIDRLVRKVIVTPDMHRVHHSSLPSETNSNYCFNLPWWDHLFASYHSQPKLGHEKMQIGLKESREIKRLRLGSLLLQPFKRKL